MIVHYVFSKPIIRHKGVIKRDKDIGIIKTFMSSRFMSWNSFFPRGRDQGFMYRDKRKAYVFFRERVGHHRFIYRNGYGGAEGGRCSAIEPLL